MRSPQTDMAEVVDRSARDSRLSLLKVLGSMGVVTVHTSMYALNQPHQSLSWWIAALGNAMGRNMSALFAMVAGAVLLARAIETQPVGFVVSRFKRLAAAVLFWSCFYLWWRHHQGENVTLASAALDLARGTPYFHLWFLFAMLGLYVLMPGARLLLRDSDTKAAQYYITVVVGLATCLAVVTMAARGVTPLLFVSYSPLLLVYLLAGYLLYRDAPTLATPWLLLAGVTCVGGTVLVMRLLEPVSAGVSPAAVQALRAPMALGWILVVYLLVMQLPRDWPAEWPNRIAPVTLGIYAVHPFWIDVMDSPLLPIKSSQMPWWLAAVLVYAVSLTSSWLMSRTRLLRPLVT